MKRILVLILIGLAVTACAAKPPPTTEPPTVRGLSAGLTPIVPAYYASWAYGTVVPPTRMPSDPVGSGLQALGIKLALANRA